MFRSVPRAPRGAPAAIAIAALVVLIALAAVVAILLPPPAFATVAGPEARIRWLGEIPAPATAGQTFEGQFEIAASGPGLVEDLTMDGPGWTLEPLATPARKFLTQGDRSVVTFRGVPADPKEPLVVRFTFNGQTFEKTLRLDAESLELAKRPRRAVSIHEDGSTREAGPHVEGSGQRVAGGPMRIMGRFAYNRGDTGPMPLIGADSIRVRIWDDDSPDPFDEVIWEGWTDQQGYFDVLVNWDDGPDDPDVYVEFSAETDHFDVQRNDFLETTYVWDNEDQVVEDFTGTLINFGTLMPGLGERGALHVFNSFVRARRYAHVHGGMAAQPHLDVQWPRDDPNQPSRYSSQWREIYITTPNTWSEYTHVHEYAHYLEDMFDILYPPVYTNPGGFCDNPTPTHCLWCRENNLVAWQEGWAEWFGMSLVNRWFELYTYETWTLTNDARQLETPQQCCDPQPPPAACIPRGLQPGFETEGFVAALLRDMEDSTNQPGPAGSPCDCDTMGVGPGPILQVVRQGVFDVYDFIVKFRLYYGEHDQDFWSTARHQTPTFGFSAPPPVVLSQPKSCVVARAGDTFDIAAVGNGKKLKYQWRKNGVELFDGPGLTGTETPTLHFANAPAHMGGTYSCMVSTCSESLSVISLPVRVTILPPVFDNPLLSWGDNRYGQAGDGTTDGPRPPGVRALSDVVAVDGGQSIGVALKQDGTVWTWGTPLYSVELGNGYSSVMVPTPTQVAGHDSVMAIAMGVSHILTLKSDGTIWSWGYNRFGQLGDSTDAPRQVPTYAKEIEGCVKAISCGPYHSLALMADGTVLAWADNAFGALGRGTSGGGSFDPLPVSGLTNVIAISAGNSANLALKSDGTVWAWGWNFNGGLGTGLADVSSNGFSSVPAQVVGLTDVRSICMSYANGYAVKNDGSCWSWGTNQNSQLGDGTWPSVTHRNVPGLMPNLVNPVSIEAGDGGFRFALMPDLTLRMWGYNDSHALGTPMPNVVPIPIQVTGVTGVTGVGTGFGTSFAFGHTGGTVEVPGDVGNLPRVLAMRASPNPSFAHTNIAFDLPRAGHVSLAVFDVRGRRVSSVFDGPREAGRYVEPWDGRLASGGRAPAGVYYLRLELEGQTVTERVVRMK